MLNTIHKSQDNINDKELRINGLFSNLLHTLFAAPKNITKNWRNRPTKTKFNTLTILAQNVTDHLNIKTIFFITLLL